MARVAQLRRRCRWVAVLGIDGLRRGGIVALPREATAGCTAPRLVGLLQLGGRSHHEHSGKAASEMKIVQGSDRAEATILAVQGQAVPVACRSERPRRRPKGRSRSREAATYVKDRALADRTACVRM